MSIGADLLINAAGCEMKTVVRRCAVPPRLAQLDALPKNCRWRSSAVPVARSNIAASESAARSGAGPGCGRSRALAAFLGFACRSFAAAGVGRDPGRVGRVSKRVAVEIKGVAVGVAESLGVILAAHPEVWEVVQVASEDGVAVLVVSTGIEDVLMPNVVNQFARHDFGVGVCEMQGEESAVFLLGEVEFGVRHAKTLFGIGQLHPDVGQIEGGVEAVEGGGGRGCDRAG